MVAVVMSLLPLEVRAQQYTQKQIIDALIMSDQKSLWFLECVQTYTPRAIKAGMTTVDFKALLVGACIQEKAKFRSAFVDWSAKAYPSVGWEQISQTFDDTVSQYIDAEVTKLAMAKLQ